MSESRGSSMSRPASGRSPGKGTKPPTGYGRRGVDACLGFAKRRPGVIAATICVLGCGGTIGWNALTQANRHPAPLFGSKNAARVEPPRRAELAAAAPAPLPAPAPVPVRRPEVAAPAPAAAVSAPPEPVAKPASQDPIGAMIRASDPSLPPESRADAKLSTAQKALTKLGYGPLRPDGLMGTTTRQALERFERDHNLPVTGALGQRTTRQLASAAGAKID